MTDGMLIGDRSVKFANPRLQTDIDDVDDPETMSEGEGDAYNVGEPPKILPRPCLLVTGKQLLIYQDPVEYKSDSGLILKPKWVADKHRPTVGTIVQIGDGWQQHEPIEAQEDWQDRCPFQIGDRVLFGRYTERGAKAPVHPEFWDDWPENPEPRGPVEFIILEPTAVWAKVLEEPI